MDFHDIEHKIEDDDGFKGFTDSEISGKITIEGLVKKEINKESNRDDNVATNNSSCDDNLSSVNQLNNIDEPVICDTKVNIDFMEENSDVKITDDTEMERQTATVNYSINSEIKNTKAPSIQNIMNQVKEMSIDETSNNKQVSSVIIKNESSSLNKLLMYNSDSSDEEENEELVENSQLYVSSSSSSSSNVSESESDESVEISEDDEDNIEFVLSKNMNEMKKNVLHDVDVPEPLDISNLQIDYEKEQFLHIGHISNFINATVTVDTVENVASYDIETILFIDDKNTKKPFGGISDVIGPVCQPVYCIQLHDTKEIEQQGLKQGMKVYSAPKSSYTKYVFLKDLLKMKGTDASGQNDKELSSDEASTDEEEQLEKHSPQKRKHNTSLDRHKKFENSKNESNMMLTRMADMRDTYVNNYGFPVVFDPTVPPPVIRCDRTRPRFFTPHNFNQPMPNRWYSPPTPHFQRPFLNPRGPRHHHINRFTNNIRYQPHYNSPGPSS